MRKNNRSSYRPARKSNGRPATPGQAHPMKAILAKHWQPFAEAVELNGQTVMLQVGAPSLAAYESAMRLKPGAPDALALLLESALPEYQQHLVHTPALEALVQSATFAGKMQEQLAHCEAQLD